MRTTDTGLVFSANEASCITGVPLKQVHRIIDAELLGSAAQGGKRSRAIHVHELVGLMFAHETADIFTLEGRRRLVRSLLDHPDDDSIHENHISVDVASMKEKVRYGCIRLKLACKDVSSDKAVLAGTPCIKGTRIPVHHIADMLSNGDSVQAICQAFPELPDRQIEHADLYARAYPRRGRPRQWPFWREQQPTASTTTNLDDLPSAR